MSWWKNPININQAIPGNCQATPVGVATHTFGTAAVEGPTERVMREEIVEAFKHLKIEKAPEPTEV